MISVWVDNDQILVPKPVPGNLGSSGLNKTVDPKFPGTGLSDIKKSFEKIALTFLARTKIKAYLCS